jgi:hypothetical protein
MNNNNQEKFEVRDLREKGRFIMDDKFLNGYARFLEIYAVGVYSSLCRYANKEQKCWPSVKKITKELSIGRNKAIDSIKYLEFWKIIKKKRVGSHCTNRYFLLKKDCWRSINEESLKEFSEVYHINLKGLQAKLQEFTTRTSIVRKHNSNETQKERGSFYKKLKPYYKGAEMRRDKRGKWWVIPGDGGRWLEFNAPESEIDWI